MFIVLLIILTFSSAISSANIKSKEAWGYVKVRPDAHQFWWLFYTDKSTDYARQPLVLWLQGGPGASSTGEGNFLEIGPLDVNLKPRKESWLKTANLLFIDNPVGCGFSYVTNKSALATTNKQIAADLVTTLSSILETVPEFQISPLYIFGESYGGKMAVDFALELSKAVKSKNIVCNFKGIALGDPLLSPYDSVSTWGPYLYATSLLDNSEVESIKPHIKDIEDSISQGQFKHAFDLFLQLQTVISNHTHSVDWFNILKMEEPIVNNNFAKKLPKNHIFDAFINRGIQNMDTDPLSVLMNGKIREKLHDIPENVIWGGQSRDVREALLGDIMKSAVDSVDALLMNESNIDVCIYSGQLDLIVDTLGTLQWIQKLKWSGLEGFEKAPKKPIVYGTERTGFAKSFKQFSFFWILKAGHQVPLDVPETALQMLDMILRKEKMA